jgi:hypothetical protein
MHLEFKMHNACVAHRDVAVRRPGGRRPGEAREQDAVSFVKLTNSGAKAGPMSGASVVGLGFISRFDLAHFKSQADISRINQRCLN